MVDYEIYNKNGFPPLKIRRKRERDEIEKEDHVRSLVDSKMLLKKELNAFLNELMDISYKISFILKFTNINPKDFFSPKLRHSMREDRDFFNFNRTYYKYLMLLRYQRSTAVKKTIENFNKKRIEDLQESSNKIQDKITKFENKFNIDLDIIEHIPIYICSNCKNLLCINKFERKKCATCSTSINSSSKTDQKSISVLSPSVKKFFEQNWWLEEGISYLLRKQNFDVKTGVYVLGSSGVEHEIDVLGSKKDGHLRLVCECKNTDINSSDIFVLAGKMKEIGCNYGILVTISSKITEDMKKLAKSFNIIIADSVLEKEDTKIMDRI